MPKRLVPVSGGSAFQIRLALGAVGADLEEVAVEPGRVGDELEPPSGSIWPSPGWMLTGRTRASSVLGPAAGAEAGAAAEHDQARPLLDGVGQELLLRAGEEVGREVAEDVDVVAAGGELVVVELAARRPAGLADDLQVGLDVGRGGDGPEPGTCAPRGSRALEVEDVQAPRQGGDERADLVVGPEQLPLLGLDPERELLLAGRLGDVLQAGDRDDLGPLGDLDRLGGDRLGLPLDEHLDVDRLVGEPADRRAIAADLELVLDEDGRRRRRGRGRRCPSSRPRRSRSRSRR